MAAVGECSIPVPWNSVSLTHVEYPAGDFTGRLLAYLSLSPIFIIVGFITLIVFKRELHTISFLGGLCFNEGVNWLIKNIVQEQRPCPEVHLSVYSKYAMPSSHSQFIWFFSIYSFLFLYLRVYLLYHTWSQVVYGGFVGSFMAALWFLFTQEILTPLFPRIAACYLTQQWGIPGNGGNIPEDARTFRFWLDPTNLFLDRAIPRGNPSKGRQFEVV
ncbi:hypothetical protein Chor_002009 [Crotalus horridus]